MSQRTRFLFPLTATALILAGCAGSGGASLNDGGSSGTSGSGSTDSGTERTASGMATSGEGAAQSVSTAGSEIKAMDMPVGGEVTSGIGEVLIASSDSISAFSSGMEEGVGNYRENDNFLGTTFAGGAMGLSEGGEAVTASGEMIASMNGLPVFMQIDESSGFVTALGGTVAELGVTLSIVGDELAAEMSDENSTFGGGTALMSAVLQPVLIMTEDGVGKVGDALLVGPAGSKMLDKSAGLMIQGAETFGSFDPRFAGPEQMMVGGAQMLSGAGRLLTNGEEKDYSVGVPDAEAPGGETGVADGTEMVKSAGETLTMMGGKIAQLDGPVGDGITSGTGEVLSGNVSVGVSAFLNAFASVVVPVSSGMAAPFDGQMMGSLPGAGEFSKFVGGDMDDGSFASFTAAMDDLTGSFPEADMDQLQAPDGGALGSLDGSALPIQDLSSLDGGQLDATGLNDLSGSIDDSTAALSDTSGELGGADAMDGALSGLVSSLSGGTI